MVAGIARNESVLNLLVNKILCFYYSFQIFEVHTFQCIY
jgi:hypothetical protein